MQKMIDGKIVSMSADEEAQRRAEVAELSNKPARVDYLQRLEKALREKPDRLVALLALLDR